MRKIPTTVWRVLLVGFVVVCVYVRPAAHDDVMPFSADMTIRGAAIDIDGRSLPIGERRFHFERVRRRGKWQTEFTMLPAPPQANLPPGVIGNLPSSLDGARVEDDGSGELRVVSASGREMKLPELAALQQLVGRSSADTLGANPGDAIRERMMGRGAGARRRVPGDNWLNGTVLRMDQGGARLSRLDPKFRRAGAVRGLQRYLHEETAETTELLVDPALGVALEANTVEHGVLTAHSTYSYQLETTGRVLKTKSRTERLAGDGRSRSVFEVEWTNIHLGAGGQQ